MHPSIALDPSANYNSPKFRSRNQSYMRAVSTLSQASCVSQVSQVSLCYIFLANLVIGCGEIKFHEKSNLYVNRVSMKRWQPLC